MKTTDWLIKGIPADQLELEKNIALGTIDLSIIEDEVYRRVAKCLFIDNITVRETADVIGYSERQIYRIKKKLTEILKEKEVTK